jgi:hypothetical protein
MVRNWRMYCCLRLRETGLLTVSFLSIYLAFEPVEFCSLYIRFQVVQFTARFFIKVIRVWEVKQPKCWEAVEEPLERDIEYCRLFHSKHKPTMIVLYGTRCNAKSSLPRVTTGCADFSVALEQRSSTLGARPLLTPVAQKLCRCEHGVFTGRTCIHSRTLPRI